MKQEMEDVIKGYCRIIAIIALSIVVAGRKGTAYSSASEPTPLDIEEREWETAKIEIQAAAPRESRASLWLRRVSGYLEIGTRSEYFSLRKRERDYIDSEGRRQTFLGSIHRLEERQNLLPFKPVVTVTPLPWLGVELAWNTLEVRTRSFTVDPTDGDFVLKGPTLQMVFRYPNSTRFTPYGGLGIVFYSVDFDHADWWHRGYPSYENWVARGCPKEYLRRYQRRFDPENTTGVVTSAGCLFDVANDWSLDLHLRYINVNVDNRYRLLHGGRVTSDRGITTFPFSHYAAGVGARYRF